MNKTQIIIIAVVGIFCFSGAFGLVWVTRPHAAAASEPNTAAETPKSEQARASQPAEESTLNQKTLSEKQLRLLVQSLRNRINEYDKKDQDLAARQQQVQSAQEMLQKDVNDLNTLRIQLAAESAAIKEEKQKLETYQLAIKADETTNLHKTATIYDKMDAASASKILINMCNNHQIDDAVKILNYMNERNAAKVLGEIGTADPKIATELCQALKRLKEEK